MVVPPHRGLLCGCVRMPHAVRACMHIMSRSIHSPHCSTTLAMPHTHTRTTHPIPIRPPRSVASPEQIQALCTALPLRHQQSRWRLLYSTALHGISLNTLFRRGANRSPCVTLVRDMQGHVFGCYASEPWQRHARYYGDGETFVFRLSPGPVEAFKWDQNSQEPNQFFQASIWGD